MNKLKYIFLISIFFLVSFTERNNLKENKSTVNIMDKFTSPSKGDYLTPLAFGIENKDSILKNVPSDLYYQIMATNFSYVGNYKKALEYWDIQSDTNSTNFDEKSIENISFKSAKSFILKKAKSERVIMFNEAHHMPLHRAFILSLLPELKKQGFNYLALEALNYLDENNLNARKSVTQSTGTYTAEPVYAELINLALTQGFKIIAYEEKGFCSESGLDCRIKREKEQALNLSNFMKTDSSAKIIVIAGYDHIMENNSFKMMAQYFQENTMINPLTIDQVDMCERSNIKCEEPTYRFISKKHSFKEPMVGFLNSSPIVLSDKKGKVDVQVIFPRTSFENDRPNWWNTFQTKKKFDLNYLTSKVEKKKWVIIQAFDVKNYDSNAIPTDQMAFNLSIDTLSDKYLYLNKGDYFIKVFSINNEKLYEQNIKID